MRALVYDLYDRFGENVASTKSYMKAKEWKQSVKGHSYKMRMVDINEKPLLSPRDVELREKRIAFFKAKAQKAPK